MKYSQMSMVYNMKVMVTSSAMMGENKTRKYWLLAMRYMEAVSTGECESDLSVPLVSST